MHWLGFFNFFLVSALVPIFLLLRTCRFIELKGSSEITYIIILWLGMNKSKARDIPKSSSYSQQPWTRTRSSDPCLVFFSFYSFLHDFLTFSLLNKITILRGIVAFKLKLLYAGTLEAVPFELLYPRGAS